MDEPQTTVSTPAPPLAPTRIANDQQAADFLRRQSHAALAGPARTNPQARAVISQARGKGLLGRLAALERDLADAGKKGILAKLDKLADRISRIEKELGL